MILAREAGKGSGSAFLISAERVGIGKFSIHLQYFQIREENRARLPSIQDAMTFILTQGLDAKSAAQVHDKVQQVWGKADVADINVFLQTIFIISTYHNGSFE